MICGHITTSSHFEPDDLDMAPFAAAGGLGKMHQHFGDRMEAIMDKFNEALED